MQYSWVESSLIQSPQTLTNKVGQFMELSSVCNVMCQSCIVWLPLAETIDQWPIILKEKIYTCELRSPFPHKVTIWRVYRYSNELLQPLPPPPPPSVHILCLDILGHMQSKWIWKWISIGLKAFAIIWLQN